MCGKDALCQSSDYLLRTHTPGHMLQFFDDTCLLVSNDIQAAKKLAATASKLLLNIFKILENVRLTIICTQHHRSQIFELNFLCEIITFCGPPPHSQKHLATVLGCSTDTLAIFVVMERYQSW